MRTKKRLRFVREETSAGAVVYRAKRKREVAIITPIPREAGGGYELVLRTDTRRQRTTVKTLADAKGAAEDMRYAGVKRNPIAALKPSKGFWWGAGIGAAIAVGVSVWLEARANAQTKAPGLPALPPAPLPGSGPGSSGGGGSVQPSTTPTLVTMGTNPVQSATWQGGPLILQPPSGFESWTSVNGQPVASSIATGPLTIGGADPRGEYQIVYQANGGVVNADLTVN